MAKVELCPGLHHEVPFQCTVFHLPHFNVHVLLRLPFILCCSTLPACFSYKDEKTSHKQMEGVSIVIDSRVTLYYLWYSVCVYCNHAYNAYLLHFSLAKRSANALHLLWHSYQRSQDLWRFWSDFVHFQFFKQEPYPCKTKWKKPCYHTHAWQLLGSGGSCCFSHR